MKEKTLTFFRVFDLAFFAPGTVLFLAMWGLGLLPLAHKTDLTTAEGAIALVASVAAIYVIGLSVHALVWEVLLPLLRFRTRAQRKEEQTSDWIPFPMRFRDSSQEEIILYFWYLRSTCWNVGIAIALSLLLWGVTELGWPSPGTIMAVCGMTSAALLIALGRRYDLNQSRTFDLLKEKDSSTEQDQQ